MTHGDIYMMDFGISFGSEPGYRRPIIIAQANKPNLDELSTTIVIPLTTNIRRLSWKCFYKRRIKIAKRFCCACSSDDCC